MANKFLLLARKRGVILLALSVVSALAAIVGGVKPMDFWEGPI